MCLSYLTLICICPSLPLFLATHAVAFLWVSWVARSTVQWVLSAGRRRREGGRRPPDQPTQMVGGGSVGTRAPRSTPPLLHRGSMLHPCTTTPLHTPPLHISTCRHSSRSLKPLVVKTSNSTLYITLNLNHYTHLQNV